MKFNLNQKMKELSSPTSPYYCGSSCFLSLFIIVKEILASSEKQLQKAFIDLENSLLSLYEEDNKLFMLSKEENLLDDDWKQVESILSDYASIIEKLSTLSSICKTTNKERYATLLNHKIEFIISLAKDNISFFDLKEGKRESFQRVCNELYVASKRDINHE